MSNNTNPPQTDGLKPCPFCGGGAKSIRNPLLGYELMAECEKCGASAYLNKWEGLTPDKRDEEIAVLREAAHQLALAAGALVVATDGQKSLRAEREAALKAMAAFADAALTHTDKGE